jgi:hypothetical protein
MAENVCISVSFCINLGHAAWLKNSISDHFSSSHTLWLKKLLHQFRSEHAAWLKLLTFLSHFHINSALEMLLFEVGRNFYNKQHFIFLNRGAYICVCK